LIVYTAVFPVFHFAGYASGLAEPSVRQAREACVFLAALVLGGLAMMAHHRLENERSAAEDRVRRQKDRLRALSHRLARAQEDERRQIARELHDEIGQQLTGLRLSLGALRHRSTDADSIDLAHIEERCSELLRHVRELSLSLRPTMLDDHGLVAALTWLFKRLEQQTGLQVTFEAPSDFCDLPTEVQLAAYRIVQEAITNVIRHAGVERVTVRLDADAHEHRVEIIDRGAGFVPESVTVGTSCGLDGMQERAELLGGNVDVRAEPGSGTRVTLRLPRSA
jgi:signal transduction histidine kinase